MEVHNKEFKWVPKYDPAGFDLQNDIIVVNSTKKKEQIKPKTFVKSFVPVQKVQTVLKVQEVQKQEPKPEKPIQKLLKPEPQTRVSTPSYVPPQIAYDQISEPNSQTDSNVHMQNLEDLNISEIERRSDCMSMMSDLDKMPILSKGDHDITLNIPIFLTIRTSSIAKCRILSIQFKLSCCSRLVTMTRDKRDKVNNRFLIEPSESKPCKLCEEFRAQIHTFVVNCQRPEEFRVASCNLDKKIARVEKIRFVTSCMNKWKGSKDALLWRFPEPSVSKMCEECQEVEDIIVKAKIGEEQEEAIKQEDEDNT